jgi:hypothetical protein
MASEGVLSLRGRHRYRHRLALDGEPLYYVALAGKKLRDVDLG